MKLGIGKSYTLDISGSYIKPYVYVEDEHGLNSENNVESPHELYLRLSNLLEELMGKEVARQLAELNKLKKAISGN